MARRLNDLGALRSRLLLHCTAASCQSDRAQITEQCTHVIERLRINLPSLRRRPPLAATGTGMNAPDGF